MPPSETISWECRGQCHCSWANQNSFKAQCCINAGVPASIKSEWCAFGVNCTWSIDAICMLITVWPFVSIFIPCALSRCEQVKWPTFSSDTSHMTLPKLKVCSFSLLHNKHKHTDSPNHSGWCRSSLLPPPPGRWHSSSTAPQLQDQRNRCWITAHFLELSSSKKFWILPGFSFPPVIQRGSRSLWKQDYAGP